MTSQKDKAIAYLRAHPAATYAQVRDAVGCSQGIVRAAKQAIEGTGASDRPADGQSVSQSAVSQQSVRRVWQDGSHLGPLVLDEDLAGPVSRSVSSQSVDRERAKPVTPFLLKERILQSRLNMAGRLTLQGLLRRNRQDDVSLLAFILQVLQELKDDGYQP